VKPDPIGEPTATLAGRGAWTEPGGFGAISRWLSVATPPDHGQDVFCIPEGCQPWPTLASRVDEHLKQRGAVWK